MRSRSAALLTVLRRETEKPIFIAPLWSLLKGKVNLKKK